ncbi:MAG TPA: thermonuclease family protein [Blastocatellia bacterium]|nr:thermonuclease family protein [Blastocatellia bacterium]
MGERSRLPLFIGLALIGGFAFGFVIAKYGSWVPPKQQGGIKENRAATPPGNNPPGAPIFSVPAVSDFHKVTDVLRADTIKIDGICTVKMLAIETPDGKEPKSIFAAHAEAALNFVKASLLGKDVRLEFDPATESTGNKDQAGNVLAYVYAKDGILLNGEMIRQGHAFVDSTHSFGKVEEFRGFEKEAIEGMRGVWGPTDSSAVASQGPGVQPPGNDHGKTDGKTDARGKKISPILPLDLDTRSGPISTSPSDPLVFVSADDHMYHKEGCPYLGKKKHEIALSEAKSEGYVPCGRCFASTVLKAP